MYSIYSITVKLVCIHLLLMTSTIYSQGNYREVNWPDPIFEHFTLADGLPENSVLEIMQDHLGYMWFGTQGVLVRYDGYNMKSYQPDASDSLSLNVGQTRRIYEDKSGTIWIGKNHGLNRFNSVSEKFKRFMHDPDDSTSISSNFVADIFEDKNRNLLIGTEKGLNLFDREKESFKHIYYKNSVYSDKVVAIVEEKSAGNILVVDNDKILIYDADEQILTDENKINPLIKDIGEINSLLQTEDGFFWIGHSLGLSKIDLKQNIVTNFSLTPPDKNNVKNYFHNLVEDKYGFIWLISGLEEEGRLVVFDPRTEKFRPIEHDPNIPHSIASSRYIWSIYEDRTGVLWVGSFYNGLNKWDRNKSKFKRFVNDPSNLSEGDFKTVFSIIEDSESVIWFGTHNGLNSLNRNTGEFGNFKYDNSENDNTVTFICKEESGTFWLGTETRGLVKFDPIRNSKIFYSNSPDDQTSIGHNTIRYILPDGDEFLWIGTRGGGLNKFNKKSGKFIRYLPEKDNPGSLSNERVECIFRDRKEMLWVGTQGNAGLNKFDATNNSFKSFWHIEGGPVVPVIHEDQKGNFWIGAINKGIILFDRESESFSYNIELSNNLIRSILEDDSGNLWVGTDYGLSKVNPETRNVKNIITSESFEGNRFSNKSAFKNSNREMLFGTSDGFILFHPDKIKDDPIPPQVVLNNVSLFNRPDEKFEYEGLITEIKELNLSYNQNDLRFDYVGLHYADPSRNKYLYKLEGYEEEWIDAGTQRNATYTNLDAGEYVFKVKACNLDGVWNEEEASIKIIISPPFWATWWAYTFYILLVLSIFYAVRRYEMNRLRLKNQVKLDEVKLKEREETDKMKSRFFANISHEFRTPLTLILGPIDKLTSETPADEIEKHTGIIRRNAHRLMNLINQLLDLSRLEAGKLKIKASKSNIVPFVKGIVMSFESLAERKDINLKIECEQDIIELYFDKEMMIKILTNLLSNAFKFTPEGGNITVTVGHAEFISASSFEHQIPKQVRNDRMIVIRVKDTGIGISEEELPKLFDRFYQVDSSQTREYEGSGLGLALIKELIELHHGSINVNSKVGTGSEFIVEFPLGRDHLKDDEIVESSVVGEKNIYIDESAFTKKTELVTQDIANDIRENKNLILLVEDNRDVREYIKDILNSHYKVEVAVNGQQGLEKAKEIMPDLIVSDVMMPEMDGIEFCRIIKTEFLTSHIPVILLTAKASHDNKIEGLETGADDYLIKPFDSKELLTRIKNLIEQRKRLKEKFGKDIHPRPESVTTNPLDDEFLKKAYDTIEKHLDDVEYDTELFAKELFVSRMQLHRKIQAITGQAPGEFIRVYRLKRAAEMLIEKRLSVTQIAYEVGYNSPSHFSKAFTKYFNCSPSEYAK
ncbi:MAG: response regulator [Ignavibacteriales bacterium]|nr:MAG: response regulator [Ignavibacteriales bacterium]